MEAGMPQFQEARLGSTYGLVQQERIKGKGV